MAKNEIAVVNTEFNLVTLVGMLGDAIAEEMEGLGSVPYDRVRIPSGGGISFELPGEDDEDSESATELVGVILYHHPVNAYWKDKFGGGNEQPDCSSFDGKQGADKNTGVIKNCATCKYNQFGSGENGSGKACKNAHRLYMLRDGNPVPLVISIPPTSLKYLRDYISKKILLKGMRCYHAVTKITLKKEKSASGITYSRTAFSFVGKLPDAQINAAEAMANSIKQADRNIDIASDYEETAPAAGDGFMDVPEGTDEKLPFDN